MITIGDLLWPEPGLRRFAAQPEMDPLTEEGALQEAQLLDVRFDASRSTVGFLFDLRTALQLREANTGVLVGYGVRELAWTAGLRRTSRTAWTVGRSTPKNENRLFGLSLSMWPDPGAQLHLIAESGSFFAGDVRLERVPDYVNDAEATILSQIAGWHSEFAPTHAVFLDSATPRS